mgnify:CR=1 FL=1
MPGKGYNPYKYTYKRGDTPITVAKAYNVTTDDIWAVNPGVRSFAYGSQLNIPRAGTATGLPPSITPFSYYSAGGGTQQPPPVSGRVYGPPAPPATTQSSSFAGAWNYGAGGGPQQPPPVDYSGRVYGPPAPPGGRGGNPYGAWRDKWIEQITYGQWSDSYLTGVLPDKPLTLEMMKRLIAEGKYDADKFGAQLESQGFIFDAKTNSYIPGDTEKVTLTKEQYKAVIAKMAETRALTTEAYKGSYNKLWDKETKIKWEKYHSGKGGRGGGRGGGGNQGYSSEVNPLSLRVSTG